MTTIIDLILLMLIIVFIIDLSGIVPTIKKAIWKKYIKIGDYTNLSLKPLDCSLCLTFWIGLIYLIIAGEFTLPLIAYNTLLAFLTSPAGDLLILIKDIFTKAISSLAKLLNI